MRPWALSMLTLLAACTNEDAAEYVLQLEPRVPVNQDPFSDEPVVKILITESGSTEIFELGALSSGSVEQNNLAGLTDATIGVVLEEDGGQPKQYDPSLLLAYGEAGPFTMATTDDNQTVPVLISAYGEVGELDEFTDDSRFLAGAAVVPGGDVYVFGGCKGYGSTGTGADNGIYKLTDLNGGDWKFEKIGRMPFADDAETDRGRCGHSVNLVGDEDDPDILVAGGRDDTDINTENAWKTAFLFDPETEEVLWTDYLGPSRAAATGRSQHIAVEMENGKILYMGGFDGSGQLGIGTTFTIYDPTDEVFTESESIDMSPVGIAAASIGPDGVLVCGGAELLTGGVDSQPLDTCFVVSQTGEDVDETEPLPIPLYGTSMTAMSDGRAIVAGGFDQITSNGQTDGEAISRAWIYQDGDWTETGGLNDARALHRLVTTPDGTVMAIGGVENGSVIFATGTNELDCPERYDELAGIWVDADACGDAAAGFDPTVTVSPSGGFVLSGGWESTANTQGGTSYGILGIGPQGF